MTRRSPGARDLTGDKTSLRFLGSYALDFVSYVRFISLVTVSFHWQHPFETDAIEV